MNDVFRVPMEVTYAIEGGEPALMAYRRWRNISRDDLAVKSGIPRQEIDAGKLLTYAATLDATASGPSQLHIGIQPQLIGGAALRHRPRRALPPCAASQGSRGIPLLIMVCTRTREKHRAPSDSRR